MIKRTLLLLLLFVPIALLAQQPTPEISISANGSQNVNLYSGWPLIVHGTIMSSLRFTKNVSAAPLVVAPNGSPWTSAIQFTAVSTSGQSFQWPLKLVGTPADLSLTLQANSYVYLVWQMSPSDVSSLPPGTYLLTASISVSNSNGWNGVVQSRTLTIQVGPEPTLSPSQQTDKALLLAQYDTNAGDLGLALTNVEQLLRAQPNNPFAIGAAANLLELQGYPTLALFQATDALTAYYQNNPGLYDPPSNLLKISQRSLTRMATLVDVFSVPGDVNGDGVVNCVDLDIVKASFGKKVGQLGFDPRADVNGDGIVNILDLSSVARQLPAGMVCQ
jgi:Dockerin type I domain